MQDNKYHKQTIKRTDRISSDTDTADRRGPEQAATPPPNQRSAPPVSGSRVEGLAPTIMVSKTGGHMKQVKWNGVHRGRARVLLGVDR